MTNYLFVYGTLKRTPGSVWHDKLIANQFEFVCTAFINAELYNLGEYPGLVETRYKSQIVEGELYCFNPEMVSLEPVDEYEECGPRSSKPHLYERKLTEVSCLKGENYQAWCYFYLGETSHLEPMGSLWQKEHSKN